MAGSISYGRNPGQTPLPMQNGSGQLPSLGGEDTSFTDVYGLPGQPGQVGPFNDYPTMPNNIPFDSSMDGVAYDANNQIYVNLPGSGTDGMPAAGHHLSASLQTSVGQWAPTGTDTSISDASRPRLGQSIRLGESRSEGLQGNFGSHGREPTTARILKELFRQAREVIDSSGYSAVSQGESAYLLSQLEQVVEKEVEFGNYQSNAGRLGTTRTRSTATSSYMSRLDSEPFPPASMTDNTSMRSKPYQSTHAMSGYDTTGEASATSHKSGSLRREKLPRACTYRGCGYTTLKSSDWSRHEEERHYPQNEYICPLCNASTAKRYNRRDRLVRHLRDDHNLKTDPIALQYHANDGTHSLNNSNWPHSCGFCIFFFNSWEERQAHIIRHFDEGKTISEWALPSPWPKDSRPQDYSSSRQDDDSDNDDDDDMFPGGSGPHPQGYALHSSGNSQQAQSNQSDVYRGIGSGFVTNYNSQVADSSRPPALIPQARDHEETTLALRRYINDKEEPSPIIGHLIQPLPPKSEADMPVHPPRQICTDVTSRHRPILPQDPAMESSTCLNLLNLGQTRDDIVLPSTVSSAADCSLDERSLWSQQRNCLPHSPSSTPDSTDIQEDLSKENPRSAQLNCSLIPKMPDLSPESSVAILEVSPRTESDTLANRLLNPYVGGETPRIATEDSELINLVPEEQYVACLMAGWSPSFLTVHRPSLKGLHLVTPYLTRKLNDRKRREQGVVWLRDLNLALLEALCNPDPRPLKSQGKFSRRFAIATLFRMDEIMKNVPLVVSDPSNPMRHGMWQDTRWAPQEVGDSFNSMSIFEDLFFHCAVQQEEGHINASGQMFQTCPSIEPRQPTAIMSNSRSFHSSLAAESQNLHEKYQMSLVLAEEYNSRPPEAIQAPGVEHPPSTEIKQPTEIPRICEKIDYDEESKPVKKGATVLKTLSSVKSAAALKPNRGRLRNTWQQCQNLVSWRQLGSKHLNKLNSHIPRFNSTALHSTRRW